MKHFPCMVLISWCFAMPCCIRFLDFRPRRQGVGWEAQLAIEAVPVGSGCVAQVYRGVVQEMVDGKPVNVAVAVKVMT